MLYISYGFVCELVTQVLLEGDLDLIEKGESDALNKKHRRNRKNVKALIKSLEKKP